MSAAADIAPLHLGPGILPVKEFGMRLLDTGDLDPVYIGLTGAFLPTSQLERWLLAYWCFYHAGSACWLSEREGPDFWAHLTLAAENATSPPRSNGRWPRSAERRHFRGEKCVEAVGWLHHLFGEPEAPVRSLRTACRADQVMALVQSWPQFGPWIGFKAADMMERCAGVPLEFPEDLGLIYREPREALDILAEHRAIGDASHVWSNLLHFFCARAAPPAQVRPFRACGVQEVETILCKWKSHWRGHYRVGKDIHEVREGLHGWGETAERMLAAMPGEVSDLSRGEERAA